jgi:hypothetical protein
MDVLSVKSGHNFVELCLTEVLSRKFNEKRISIKTRPEATIGYQSLIKPSDLILIYYDYVSSSQRPRATLQAT